MEELPVHGYVTGLFHVEILQPVTAVLKSHRTIEGLYYLLKGNIRWRPGADNRLIKEGTYQWYYLPKGKQQEIGLQPGFYLFFYFIVPPFIASEMAGAAPHVETLRQREIKLPSLKTGNKINRWVTEIISCREQQAISRNMYIVERLIGLQKWYLKITPGLQLEQQWKERHQFNLRDLDLYLEQHMDDSDSNPSPLRLSSVAAWFGLLPAQFTLLLKEVLQTRLATYIVQYRMERAKQMLEEGKLSITEISLKTGYNNLTHFSRAFKKYHGNNPNHYRKE